jgi:hypothetical protein
MSKLNPNKLSLIEQVVLHYGHNAAYRDDPSLTIIDLGKHNSLVSRNRIAELSNFDALTKTRVSNIINFLDTLANRYSNPDSAKSIAEFDGSLGRACSKLMFFLDEHFYNGVSQEAQALHAYDIDKTKNGIIFRAFDDLGKEKYRYEYSLVNEDYDKTVLYIGDSAKVHFINEIQSLNKNM